MLYCVLDTETTGLPSKSNPNYEDLEAFSTARMLSFAWALFDNNHQMIKCQYFLVKPEFFIDEDGIAYSINKISNNMVQCYGYSIEIIMKKFIEDMEKVTNIIGHNVKFDRNIILSEIYRYNKNIANFPKLNVSILNIIPIICTMKLAYSKNIGNKWIKLAALYKYLYDVKTISLTLHDALADLLICQLCYKKLIEK